MQVNNFSTVDGECNYSNSKFHHRRMMTARSIIFFLPRLTIMMFHCTFRKQKKKNVTRQTDTNGGNALLSASSLHNLSRSSITQYNRALRELSSVFCSKRTTSKTFFYIFTYIHEAGRSMAYIFIFLIISTLTFFFSLFCFNFFAFFSQHKKTIVFLLLFFHFDFICSIQFFEIWKFFIAHCFGQIDLKNYFFAILHD